MAVTEQSPTSSFTANGVTTVFAFAFLLLQESDLVVQVTDTSGVVTTKTLGMDYTIAGVGVATGGTVTFTAAPASDYKVVIFRDSAIERATDYQNNGDLLAETVNKDFDRLWLVLQEIFNGGKGAPTSLRVPNGETIAALPVAADRANKVQAYDSDGNPILIVGVDASSAAALQIDIANSASPSKGAGQVGFAYALGYGAGTIGKWLKDLALSTGAGFIGWIQTGTGAVLRTVQDKLREVQVSATDFGADPTGAANSTTAIANALAAASVVTLPSGTFTVSDLSAVAGRTIKGAGSGKTTLKILAGSTANIINGAVVSGFTLEGVLLDYTGGGAGTGIAGFFSGCSDLTLLDVKTKGTKGLGLWLYNCPNYRLGSVSVDSATDWGILIDGALTTGGWASELTCTNCTNRGVMMRGVSRCQTFGVRGISNGGTALWMLDCLYCLAFGVDDYLDAGGDSAVIEGASIGCSIFGVTAKTCGGHCASISSSATAAPANCSIHGVYSDGQGESIAVITDQGTGFKPTDCRIDGVLGKNCGRVTPSEGFGFGNTSGCVIDGTITDTLGTMTYACRESGASPSNNRFIVGGWVSGSTAYFQIGSSTSTIEFPKLERGHTRLGDADLAWNPGTSRRNLLVDTAALTAIRTITLGVSWPGDRVRVSRISGGAFNLVIKQGATTLKTLTAAAQWEDFYCDGANWNIVAGGSI